MFTLGVVLDILRLYIWPSDLIVEDIRVLLFQERIADADMLLRKEVLTEGCLQEDLAELVKHARSGQNWGAAIVREINVSLTWGFAYVETLMGWQGSEVPLDDSATLALVFL